MNAIDRDDAAQKIAEIREALEKATPGPWVYDDIFDDIYADKTDVIVCYTVGPEDGRLIANAPEWLQFLLEERDKLIEVLRWYADEDTHMIKRRSDGDYAPIALDHGKRARDILKEIGVTDV